MREDRFDLRGKNEAAACMIKIKRLNTDAIARQNELLAFAVPKGDGKIACDFVHEIEAALFIEMNDRFTVGARGILVAALFQPGAKGSAARTDQQAETEGSFAP